MPLSSVPKSQTLLSLRARSNQMLRFSTPPTFFAVIPVNSHIYPLFLHHIFGGRMKISFSLFGGGVVRSGSDLWISNAEVLSYSYASYESRLPIIFFNISLRYLSEERRPFPVFPITIPDLRTSPRELNRAGQNPE